MRVEQLVSEFRNGFETASRSAWEMLYGFAAALDVRSGAGGERATAASGRRAGAATGSPRTEPGPDDTECRRGRREDGQPVRWYAGSSGSSAMERLP
jgi:hypothetical protein